VLLKSYTSIEVVEKHLLIAKLGQNCSVINPFNVYSSNK
jgi:hypothetical protein